jgi:formate C-acetyltransferase
MDGGGAIYNYGVCETAGSAAVADCFAAIEKLVFIDKKLTLAEIEEAIASNFEGHEDVRQMLLSAPKFGNDDDFADKWHVRILEFFWGELSKHRSVRGGAMLGACSLLELGVAYGHSIWALPDGRRKGEPLGNSIGPRPGNDKNGVTAMLKSVTKLPLHLGLGGTTLNVLLPQIENKTEEQREKTLALIRTYLENGGQMAQITTANLDDLLDAQIHPEDHENLIVRVGGLSAKFVKISKHSQNEVITRFGQ